MSFLPIVERELRVVARKPSLYRTRTLVALLSTGVAFVFLVAGYFSGSTRLGGQVFSTLVMLAFVYCLFEGLRGADSLSEEKREGTLGLLFLTDLRGYDVVLGKLVAIAVRSLHRLLAFLPVLAMSLILGGVTAGEFWRSALVLLNTLFFSLSIALCVSAFSRQAHRALSGTVLSLALITVGPLLLQLGPMTGLLKPLWAWIAVVSPATAIRDANDLFYRTASEDFWASLGFTHCLSWLALATAGLAVRTSWREGGPTRGFLLVAERWQKWRAGEPKARIALRQHRLDVNPFFWLSARYQRDPLLIGLVFGVISLPGFAGWFASVRFVAVSCSAIATVMLLAWLGWRAVQTFAEARQSGALELLLVTPVRIEEMIHGQWLALKELFLCPAAFVLLLRLVALFAPAGGSRTSIAWQVGWQWPFAGFDALSFVVSLLGILWLGMWMGVSQRKLPRAFLLTMLFGLILPAVIFCIPNIAIHLGLLSWARRRLLHEFRRAASGEFTAHQRQMIRPHLLPNANVPPVILHR